MQVFDGVIEAVCSRIQVYVISFSSNTTVIVQETEARKKYQDEAMIYIYM